MWWLHCPTCTPFKWEVPAYALSMFRGLTSCLLPAPLSKRLKKIGSPLSGSIMAVTFAPRMGEKPWWICAYIIIGSGWEFVSLFVWTLTEMALASVFTVREVTIIVRTSGDVWVFVRIYVQSPTWKKIKNNQTCLPIHAYYLAFSPKDGFWLKQLKGIPVIHYYLCNSWNL